jgi:hypothetical protein
MTARRRRCFIMVLFVVIMVTGRLAVVSGECGDDW